MKIWCCLCFAGEEEDDEEQVGEEDKGEAMREGVFGDTGNPEGRIGNDEDTEQLGLAANRSGRDEQLRRFEDAVVAMRGSAHWEGAPGASSLFPRFLISQGSEGEASSASGAAALTGVEDRDRDSHSKRAKVHFDFQ
jgi:hypothetical protein